MSGKSVKIDLLGQVAETRHRLDDLTRLVSDWVWETDADFTLTYVSDRVNEVLGIHPHELLGKSLLEAGTFLSEDETPFELRWRSPFRDVLFETHDGENHRRFFRVSGLPVFDLQSGRFKGVRGTSKDITERKRIEEALLRNSERLQEILEASHIGFAISRIGDGMILFANTRLAEMFGVPSEQFVGSYARDYYVDPSQRRELLEQFEKGREVKDAEVLFNRSDGTTFWALVTLKPTRFEGEPCFFAWVHDITRRKRMEQELVESQKMKAVGQLTGGVAHDFNNILQVILGNLSRLQKGVHDTDLSRHIANAIKAGERGAGLIQQLLSFSRRQMLRPEVADVNEVVLGMTLLLHRTLGEDTVIKTKFVPNPWPITIDSGNLEIAILNLALNAREAMPEGGTLSVETANVQLDEALSNEDGNLSAGRYVVLTMSDSGRGMAPEALERAFEPFFTTKDVGQGSGLGLSMVYGFAKQSGGHVEIDSKPGKGTSIRMYIPATET